MDGIADFESAGRGSIPRRGTERVCPGSVLDRTRAREARRPGSIPGWDTDWTLEPDGEAAGCNPAEVGSIPTGVSDRPTGHSNDTFLRGGSALIIECEGMNHVYSRHGPCGAACR